MNLGILDEIIICNHLLEFFLRDEVVMDAVLLIRSHASSCVRNAECEHIRKVFLHLCDKRAFSCTRGTHYHQWRVCTVMFISCELFVSLDHLVDLGGFITELGWDRYEVAEDAFTSLGEWGVSEHTLKACDHNF